MCSLSCTVCRRESTWRVWAGPGQGREGDRELLSHFALGRGFAYGRPPGVGQAVLGVALRGDGGGSQGGYGGALRRLLLEELLRLAVVQRRAAGLEGHRVRAHAGVQAAPRRLDLLQVVVPVQLVVGQ